MIGDPGPHPSPPLDLSEREPAILETDQSWFRIYTAGREVLHFGTKPQNRFDSPDGHYGVLYVAADEFGAFIETFGQATGINTVTASALRKGALAEILARRRLRLIDLVASGGLARIGADARLFAGERSIARTWSAALKEHPSRPDGIQYPARHDPSRAAAAIFEGARVDLEVRDLGHVAEERHAELLGRILDEYGFGLVDDRSV